MNEKGKGKCNCFVMSWIGKYRESEVGQKKLL